MNSLVTGRGTVKPIVGGTVHACCAGPYIAERSRFEPLQESLCCVLWQALFRQFTLTMLLSTQVYKWVPASLMPGVTLRWTSIRSREEWKYSYTRFMLRKPEIRACLMSHQAGTQTLPLPTTIDSIFRTDSFDIPHITYLLCD